jgi:hypothetical protein
MTDMREALERWKRLLMGELVAGSGDMEDLEQTVNQVISEIDAALSSQTDVDRLVDAGLAVLRGDTIVITADLSQIGLCFDMALNQDPNTPDLVISDKAEFANELVYALNDEKENGDTLVHEMLDEAIRKAVDGGAFGVEEATNAFGKGDDDAIR